jgi:hypothetical protein
MIEEFPVGQNLENYDKSVWLPFFKKNYIPICILTLIFVEGKSPSLNFYYTVNSEIITFLVWKEQGWHRNENVHNFYPFFS